MRKRKIGFWFAATVVLSFFTPVTNTARWPELSSGPSRKRWFFHPSMKNFDADGRLLNEELLVKNMERQKEFIARGGNEAQTKIVPQSEKLATLGSFILRTSGPAGDLRLDDILGAHHKFTGGYRIAY